MIRRLGLVLALALPVFAQAARAWLPTDLPDSVLVTWKRGLDRAHLNLEAQALGLPTGSLKEDLRQALAVQAGGVQKETWARLDASRVQLAQGGGAAVNAALARLEASGLVQSAEPDAIATLAAVCSLNDPLYTGGYQKGLTSTAWPQAVAAYCAGSITLRSQITVAILDTGVDAHADLATVLLTGTSFIPGEGTSDDLQGHGTFVASLVAAETGNGQGLAGAFFDPAFVRILPVKVLDTCGNGSLGSVINGVTYAVGAGARVLNLSLQFPEGTVSSALDRALVDARSRGALVVCAAGNITTSNPSSFTGYPGSHPLVVTVGALSSTGARTFYSRYGKVDLSAPGGDGLAYCPCLGAPGGCPSEIWGLAAIHPTCLSNTACAVSNGYSAGAGTSFAAPLVAGAAALLFSQDPSRSPEAVLQRLLQSALPTSEGSGYHSTTGWGKLNFYGALMQSGPLAAGSALKVWNWPNPFSPSRDGRTTLSIQGQDSRALRARLFDAGGDLVKQWDLPESPANAGLQLLSWDGRNGQGQPVANGSYSLVVDGAAGRALNRVAVLQ